MDRYLVQFQELGKDYFVTDCAFRDGQSDLAVQYVRLIVGNLAHIVAGQVLDTDTCINIYTLRPHDKLAVNIESLLVELQQHLALLQHSVSGGVLAEANAEVAKQRLLTRYATQIAGLIQP